LLYNRRRPHSSLDDMTPDQASTFRRSAWRPNPGRGSTYRRGISVQTRGPALTSKPSEITNGASPAIWIADDFPFATIWPGRAPILETCRLRAADGMFLKASEVLPKARPAFAGIFRG
jgi:hypothetical protein